MMKITILISMSGVILNDFIIGGFQPTITETKLANYIRRRGPKVTKVSISRKRRFGNVVIQVNVEDDENANAMTDDPYFWPRGVICRPWVPYNSYRARQKETRGIWSIRY